MARNRVQSLLLMIASSSLIGWMVYLLQALPRSYRAEHWNIAWFGYDLAMTITLLATSWALWNKRQAAIPGAMISATLLLIDSWFDVITSNPGWDFKFALVTSLLIELPTAMILFGLSTRAIHLSIHNAHLSAGRAVTTTSLWKTQLTIFENE